MTNLKSNLRKVATIIACLTVTTMFASCGGNKDDGDGNGDGKTDTKLVGYWVRSIGTSDLRSNYTFRNDGSFSFVRVSGSIMTTVNGKYTTSNGRVSLTDLVDDRNEKLKSQSMGYSFGKDNDGEYLSIAEVKIVFVTSSSEATEGSPTKFWRSK